jgi:hypothetical protein
MLAEAQGRFYLDELAKVSQLDVDAKCVLLKDILETWNEFVKYFESPGEEQVILLNNPELPKFVESLFNLFFLFKWPPWQKYNKNAALKEEFEKKLVLRAKFVQQFFDGGGVEIVLSVIQFAGHEDLVC